MGLHPTNSTGAPARLGVQTLGAIGRVQRELAHLERDEPGLAGYGAQMDTAIFTRRGQPHGLSAAQHAELKRSLEKLKPEHVRIFVQPEMLERFAQPGLVEPDQDHLYEALVKTVKLAQDAGATANLTLWHGNYYIDDPKKRQAMMTGLARLVGALRRQGLTSVRDLTIQNEPNTHDLSHEVRQWKQAHPGKRVPAGVREAALKHSLALYDSLYRDLDRALKQIPDPAHPGVRLRDHVRLVGGDLLKGKRSDGSLSQDVWLKHMAAQLHDVVDAYSLHVYWTAGANGRKQAEARLKHAQDVVAHTPHPKPIYVTEYGAKAGTPHAEPGKLKGIPVEETVPAAFDHAWFNAAAPHYGVVGLDKWAAYATDGRSFKDWGMIRAPKTGFEKTPLYRMTRLFTAAVPSGWTPTKRFSHGPDTLVSGFAGPQGQSSLVALNGGARSRAIALTGLQPGRRYHLTVWNAEGKGLLHQRPAATADAQGRLSVQVPAQGVVAVTSEPTAI